MWNMFKRENKVTRTTLLLSFSIFIIVNFEHISHFFLVFILLNVLNVEHVFVRYKLFVFLHYLLLFIERDIFGWNFSGGNSEFLGRQNFKVSKEALKQDKPFLTFLNYCSTMTVFLDVFRFSTVWANLCQKWIWNVTNKSRLVNTGWVF